jgi:polar amino acid transport system substrate-binding protein
MEMKIDGIPSIILIISIKYGGINLMKSFLLTLFLLLSFTVLCNEGELEIVTDDWPPFILDGKKVSGLVTKNVREILKYTDIKYSITVYPWARSFHLAKTKPNILIYSIYRTKQRESQFNWICPIYKSRPIHAYKLVSNSIDINSIEAIKKGVVGIMRGDNSYSYLLNNGFQEGVNIDLSSNEETNLIKLIKGRVDVVIQSEESLNYRLKSLGVSALNIASGLAIGHANNVEHCMALSIGTKPEIINKIRKGFDKWQQNQQ